MLTFTGYYNADFPLKIYSGPLIDALMNTLFDIDDYKHGRSMPRPAIVEVKYTDPVTTAPSPGPKMPPASPVFESRRKMDRLGHTVRAEDQAERKKLKPKKAKPNSPFLVGDPVKHKMSGTKFIVLELKGDEVVVKGTEGAPRMTFLATSLEKDDKPN